MKRVTGVDCILLGFYPETAARGWKRGCSLGFLIKALNSNQQNDIPDGIKAFEKFVRFLKKEKSLSGEDLNLWIPWVRVTAMWKDNPRKVFYEKDISKILRQQERFEELVLKYPKIKFAFQLMLENKSDDDVTRKANVQSKEMRKVFKKNNGKGYRIINPGVDMKGIWDEVHHSSPVARPYVYSDDGYNTTERSWADTIRKHTEAKLLFVWNEKLNGLNLDSSNPPRPERKNWPSVQDIKAYCDLAKI